MSACESLFEAIRLLMTTRDLDSDGDDSVEAARNASDARDERNTEDPNIVYVDEGNMSVDHGTPLLIRRLPDDQSPARQERLRRLDATRSVEWLEEALPHPVPIRIWVQRQTEMDAALSIIADQWSGSEHESILRDAVSRQNASLIQSQVRSAAARILGVVEATNHAGVQVVVSAFDLFELVRNEFESLAKHAYPVVGKNSGVVVVGAEPGRSVRFVPEIAGDGERWVPTICVDWRDESSEHSDG